MGPPRMSDYYHQGWMARGSRGSGHAYKRFVARQAQKAEDQEQQQKKGGAWSSAWPTEESTKDDDGATTWSTGAAPWTSSARRADTPPPAQMRPEAEQTESGGTGDATTHVAVPRRFPWQKVLN